VNTIENTENIHDPQIKKPFPFLLVFTIWLLALVITVYKVSTQEYGGFNYFDSSIIIQDVIAQSLGAVIIAPLLHIAIASIWKTKRNSRTRRNIFFGWSLFSVIATLNLIFQYA